MDRIPPDIHRLILLLLPYDKFLIYYDGFAINLEQAQVLLNIVSDNNFWLAKLRSKCEVNHTSNDWKNVYLILEAVVDLDLDQMLLHSTYIIPDADTEAIRDINPAHVNPVTLTQGHPDVIRVMLDNEMLDPNYCEDFAIKWAVKNNHLDMLDMLLDHKSESIIFNGLLDDEYIVYSGSPLRVSILEKGMPTTNYFCVKFAGLIYAAAFSTPDILSKFLLRARFSRSHHHELLELFVKYGQSWVAQFFLETKVFEYVHNPAYYAAIMKRWDVVDALIVDPRIVIDDKIWTIAADNSINKTLGLLLKDNRFGPGDHLNSSLLASINCNNLEGVRLLLADDRVDVGFNDNEALKAAIRGADQEIIATILTKIEIDDDELSVLYLRHSKPNAHATQ